ncbi:MAG: sulfatase-like hydrolase/transferase [Pseudomonadota bacterium]
MMEAKKPNILIIITDQQRHPPVYESEEVRQFRREKLIAEECLRESGISFERHYTMSTACTPSRASFLTGQYPSLHGVTQTDGLAKSADGDEMTWLAHDTVPTIGDWFRAGGYRTFYKGKWHVSHAHLEGPDGEGYLQTLDKDGNVNADNVAAYLDADLLDDYGFSEWVGPEAHGMGAQNTGTARDPFTADETIALLKRLDKDENKQPWLTVCSFLNPHDICAFGVAAWTQGLSYDFDSVPRIPEPPTQDEDLSTKPACQKSFVDAWGKMLAPQPWIEAARRFYYQLQRTVDEQIGRVLDTLKASGAHENTIVIFTTDHGDMGGAHGGMHQKWHNAYEETVHIPFVVSSPLIQGGRFERGIPTSHADLLPTLLGLAGIDHDEALKRVAAGHSEARPLVGRDLSGLIRGTGERPSSDPVLFITDDEISQGSAEPGSPIQRWARKLGVYADVVQPNHIECVVAKIDIDGEQHLVKLSRNYDNQQFWAVPDQRDEQLHRGKKIVSVTEPAQDEYELYDLTLDPLEQINLAHPRNADNRSRKLHEQMLRILIEQLAAKRLVPASGGLPGYRPPVMV